MTRRFAIIGSPVGHSLSPLIHRTAFQALGLDCTYDPLEIVPEDLADALRGRLRRSYVGFNVTIPHKERILHLLDEVSADARMLGAVNTVTVTDGRLKGTNTDVAGVVASLAPHRAAMAHSTAVLIGSGGAARAVAGALIHLGPPGRIVLIARSPERARALADAFSRPGTSFSVLSPGPDANRALAAARLVVNTTPVGMYPHEDETPVPDPSVFTRGQIVMDAVYRPRTTRFLAQAAAGGALTIDGSTMLLRQAAAAFELWHGRPFDPDLVRPELDRALQS